MSSGLGAGPDPWDTNRRGAVTGGLGGLVDSYLK